MIRKPANAVNIQGDSADCSCRRANPSSTVGQSYAQLPSKVFGWCLPCDSATQMQKCGRNGLLLFIQWVVISRIFLEILGIKSLKSENRERLHTAQMLSYLSDVNMPMSVSNSDESLASCHSFPTNCSLIFTYVHERNWYWTTRPWKFLSIFVTLKSVSAHTWAGTAPCLVFPPLFPNVSWLRLEHLPCTKWMLCSHSSWSLTIDFSFTEVIPVPSAHNLCCKLCNRMTESTGCGTRLPGSKSWWCHLLAV